MWNLWKSNEALPEFEEEEEGKVIVAMAFCIDGARGNENEKGVPELIFLSPAKEELIWTPIERGDVGGPEEDDEDVDCDDSEGGSS